jgi:hypothetical protein
LFAIFSSKASAPRDAAGKYIIFTATKTPLLRTCLFISFCICFFYTNGQTIGGHSAFTFLKLPSNPLLTAAGGVNTSCNVTDVGLATNNPALLNNSLHGQLQTGFTSLMGGVKAYTLTTGFYSNNLASTFSGQVYFVDYGTIPQTDGSGNVSGNFRPLDFVIQMGAARKYLQRWQYGMNLKFINSSYGTYGANAIAVDVGLLYTDSANGLTFGVLAKNMGLQLKTFAGENEDLPFDLQIGVTKLLQHAPLGFSLTAQHSHRFDILYKEDTFMNGDNSTSSNSFFAKMALHFVLATHIYAGEHLEVIFGYNHLRRTELNVGTTANGLNGFSAGWRVKFEKLQVLYARANYQRHIAYNQVAVTIQLNELLGLGVM